MAGAFAHADFSLLQLANLRKVYLGDDGGREVGLFINDYTPVPGVQITDLTEPGVAGYARQPAGAVDWLRGEVAHVQILTATQGAVFTTTDTTGELCYGYFVYYIAAGELEWAQRFDTPQMLVSGVPISFTPREKWKDCPD